MIRDLDEFRCTKCGNLHELCFCGDDVKSMGDHLREALDSFESIQDERDYLLKKSLEYMETM